MVLTVRTRWLMPQASPPENVHPFLWDWNPVCAMPMKQRMHTCQEGAGFLSGVPMKGFEPPKLKHLIYSQAPLSISGASAGSLLAPCGFEPPFCFGNYPTRIACH